ncbi:MAG TPA: hypothetical protein DF383_11590 [Deltaproteobacteria bacterium]|nr:hypothetical protein [Deltaproteobacteria bacterium]
MTLKLNIRPELEKEIEELLPKAGVHSKTEYINQAIAAYNERLKREFELRKLKEYFPSYHQEAQAILHEFSGITNSGS